MLNRAASNLASVHEHKRSQYLNTKPPRRTLMYINPKLLLEIYSTSSTVETRNITNKAMPFRRVTSSDLLEPKL
jgi:hypothetical protein